MRPAAFNYLRILLPAVLLSVHACASDNGTSQPPLSPPPLVLSVNPTVVSPGDMITIVGENFSAVPQYNRVVFNNELAKAIPDAASAETLRVTVPDYAVSGAMYVVTSGQRSGNLTMEVQRAVGDVWVVGGAQDYQFTLAAPNAIEEYTLVAYSAAAGVVADYAYTVTPDTASAYPLSLVDRRSPRSTETLQERFDAKRWRLGMAPPEARVVRGLRTRHAQPGGPQTPRDFLVVNCTDESCDLTDTLNYVTVTAELKTTGTHVLVYADVNQPTGSFTQTDYDNFAALFDGTIFPVDTMSFAPPTDVDGNGKVIVVFTPQVNQLTPDGTANSGGAITGFFHPPDLAKAMFPDVSNDGEILYLIVPDPNGETGNIFAKSRVDSVVPAVAAHEFEHVLSYGHRFLVMGGGSDPGLVQDRWLEEGMAHVAEDLNGIDFGNIQRVNRYLVDPGKISLKGADVIEQRGGIFLFLRYLGDRFGDGVYGDIVQTVCRGESCVELATGESFDRLLEDFFAALYLSQRGITSDPRFNFTSFDIQQDFDPLPVTPRAVADGGFGGTVQTAAGDYYALGGLDAPAALVNVAGESAAAQIRTIVIRTQ
jgi:hypothetical protein